MQKSLTTSRMQSSCWVKYDRPSHPTNMAAYTVWGAGGLHVLGTSVRLSGAPAVEAHMSTRLDAG